MNSNRLYRKSGLLAQIEQDHLEDEGGVGAYACRSILTIGEVSGDGDFPHAADGHVLKGFCETGDDLGDVELNGAIRLVKDGAVDESPSVHHGGRWRKTVNSGVVFDGAPSAQHLELYPAGGGGDTISLGVLRHVGFTRREIKISYAGELAGAGALSRLAAEEDEGGEGEQE